MGAEREVLGRELQVGDVVRVWWRNEGDMITALDPYTGPLSAELGEGAQVARFAVNTLGMTVEPEAPFAAVHRTGDAQRAVARTAAGSVDAHRHSTASDAEHEKSAPEERSTQTIVITEVTDDDQ